MTKFVTYESMQEALRLTAEAAEKQEQPLARAVVENFAASLHHVRIEQHKPFRGQTYADMATSHTDWAARHLAIARGTNDATVRSQALRDALEHLDEARRMAAMCAVKVNEDLQRNPGDAVRLDSDEQFPTTTIQKP
jgi:hypothetical protein